MNFHMVVKGIREKNEELAALRQQLADAREALPDEIDLFRIIRAAGRSNISKARAVAAVLARLTPPTEGETK